VLFISVTVLLYFCGMISLSLLQSYYGNIKLATKTSWLVMNVVNCAQTGISDDKPEDYCDDNDADDDNDAVADGGCGGVTVVKR